MENGFFSFLLLPSNAIRPGGRWCYSRWLVGNTVSSRIYFSVHACTLGCTTVEHPRRPCTGRTRVCELYGYSIRCRRPDRVVMRLCVIRGSQLRVRLYFWPSIRPPRQIYCPTMNRNRVYAPKRFPFIVPYRWPVYDRATFNIPAPRMRLGFEFASDKKLARISINVSRCNCIVAQLSTIR